MRVDCLQYVAPSAKVFRQMREGNVDVVHVTVCYHEDFDGVVANLQNWNHWFEVCSDMILRATNMADIQRAKASNRTAILFGLQNPLPFGTDLRRIELLRQMGVSFAQVTYNQQSLLGAGCFEPVDSGLTAFGREAVAEMNRVGMVVDLSHAGHKTAMDTVAFSTRPVTVTHANPDKWHSAPRNLHHDLIQALADTGGMMGYSLYPHHLQGGSDCSLANFCEMAAEMADSYGANVFGIGSDLCQDQPDAVVNWMRNGHWRKIPAPSVAFPSQPVWFKDNRDFDGIEDGLVQAGLSATCAKGILGDNWMQYLEKALVPE